MGNWYLINDHGFNGRGLGVTGLPGVSLWRNRPLNQAFKSEEDSGGLPGGLVVRIQCFHCCIPGSVPHVGPRAHKPCGAAKIKKIFCKCEEDFTRWRSGRKSIQSEKSAACLRAMSMWSIDITA